MSAPTVNVTVQLDFGGGPPCAGVTVHARLDINDIYQGFVISKDVTAVTDASGTAVLALFPNNPTTGLGETGSTWRITAQIPGGKRLDVTAQIPNTDCNLDDVADREPVAGLSAAQAAEDAAQGYAVAAHASEVAAAASEAQTGLDATATAGDRVQTGLDAAAAAQSAIDAEASRDAIDNRIYPGTYASDPTTRPDGSAIQAGDEYFNSTSNLTKRYNGATWVASDINTADLAAPTGSASVGTIADGAGAVPRMVQDKLREWVSAEDCGILSTNTGAQNRAAMAQTAIDHRGKAILFFDKRYPYETDGGSVTLEEISIIGTGIFDGISPIDRGSVFEFTGTTNSPFKIRRGVTIEGMGIYYPNQADSFTPTVYPVTLNFDFTNGPVQFVFIKHNVVYNAYRFCDIDNGSSGAVGHCEIEKNFICALNRGIYLRYNAELVRIVKNTFTFGFWLDATEAGAAGYMRANCTNIEIAQTDGVDLGGNMYFGSLHAIKAGGIGNCLFVNVDGSTFDQVRYAFRGTGAGNVSPTFSGCIFSCFNSQDHTLQSIPVYIDTLGAGLETITIGSGNQFLIATEDLVKISGDAPTREVNVSSNSWMSWAAYKAAGVYGALNVSGALTNLNVAGGTFVGVNSAAHSNGIMGTLNALQVIGAGFNGCLAPLNVTANSVTSTGNTSFVTGGATSDVVNATSYWSTGNHWDKPGTTGTKPQFHVRKAASQTIGAGPTDLVWGTEVFDKGGNFATPSFTAPVAGRYEFFWSLMHDNTGAPGDRWTFTLLGSVSGSFSWSYLMVGDYNSVSGHAFGQLVAGETVKLSLTRSSGAGNFVTFNDGNSNVFCGHLVE